ncbi:MAG: invasion associated locus B family protein [Xanthobacteraceae bacterium]|nr:invasion associated locus B family protein [Xanthobacteraceae bacterium]
MIRWFAFASVRPTACALALALIGAAGVVATTPNSFAEEKKAAPKAPKGKEAPKAVPKQEEQPEAPQLMFSPWTKFCQRGQEANAKQVCFIGKEGRVETGQPVVSAVLIEPEGEPRKILRVTLPLGMSLQPGTRAIVDQGQPMTAPYVICFDNGCMADYEASQALIDTMKKGQGLAIQGINGAGQAISVVLPLNDFAKAYDGPPIEQKELERRNEELRKKFEQQQQQKK